MIRESYRKRWKIGHKPPKKSFKFLNVSKMEKFFRWANLRSMYIGENSWTKAEFDQCLRLIL